MMKKMMKRAIAVGLAIAVGGVLIPTNLQSAKPEVQAAASVKGTWTLIDTEYHQPENYIKSYDSGNYYRIEFGEPKELDNGDVQLFVSRYHSWTSPKGSCETLSTSVCSAPNSSYKSDEVAYLNESITSQFTGRGGDATCSARVDKSNTDEISFWATPYYGNFEDVNKSGKSWLTRTYEKDGNGTSTMRAKYKFPWGHEGDTLSVYFYDHTGWLTSGEHEDLWPYFKWTYKFTPDSSSSTTAPVATSTPKPSAAPTVNPTSAPTVTISPTSAPAETPVPTTEPVVTPVPTSDPGTGDTTDYRSKPKFKTYWTHNQDVLNIYSTSGTKVKVKPLNKLAKSSSIKWIKNGKTAKICWIKNYKPGKYKFRFTCKGTASWKPGKKTWVITAS